MLVQGNKISKISTKPITPDPATKIIDGTGRTLMPGLIDAHTHIMLAAIPMQTALTADMQYTPEEIHAAVEAASNWNTYVTVHAYTPAAIQMAIGAGVKCIEHGQLADEATVKLMAQKGIWWSLQPFLLDENSNKMSNPASQAKQLEVSQGTDNAYRLAKLYHVKTAWGTDILFSPTGATSQNRQLAKLIRWYTPAEVLRMATGDNA